MNALKRKANDLEEKARALSDTKIIKSSLLVIALFVWVAIGTGFALSALDRRQIVDATFETTSALTTTGMSTGYRPRISACLQSHF